MITCCCGVTACGGGGSDQSGTSTRASRNHPQRSHATHGKAHRGSAKASDPLAHGSGVALGVDLDSVTTNALEAFTALAGIRPKIVMYYQTWSDPLYYASEMQAIAKADALPLISWDPTINGEGVALSEIADGRYDSYIKSAARAARAWKGRIYIRFAHEMNLKGSPFGPGRDGNTPAAFVAAWRHLVTIFRQQGATNVEWVWSPNVDCQGACPFTPFYPGDAWVDWVALDGYNYASIDNDVWLQFAQIFGPSYRILTRLTNKPVMIGETASTEDGGSKAQWISDLGPELRTQLPRVRALVWFQRYKETDWRINSSASSLRAFRALMHSPPFSTGR